MRLHTDLAKGDKVDQGQKLGRALGEIAVELTRGGPTRVLSDDICSVTVHSGAGSLGYADKGRGIDR